MKTFLTLKNIYLIFIKPLTRLVEIITTTLGTHQAGHVTSRKLLSQSQGVSRRVLHHLSPVGVKRSVSRCHKDRNTNINLHVVTHPWTAGSQRERQPTLAIELCDVSSVTREMLFFFLLTK